jgi:hypothetical protein
MKTMNKNVAVEPLKTNNEQKREVRGLDMSDRMVNNLIATKVIFDSDTFRAGTTVYVRAETVNLPQARMKMKINETEFILLPEEIVVAHTQL